MTETATDPVFRIVTPDEAITSVVGYLRRASAQLAVDHVGSNVTTPALREFRDGLGVMSSRLNDVAAALDAGSATVLVTDECGGILLCTVCGDIMAGDQYREHPAAHPEQEPRYRVPDRF
jgi:hypothetical protein